MAGVIDAVGPLSTYSRAGFSAGGVDFVEGTNKLDGASADVFTTANPVDDAGQTRTRNQRSVLRALLNALDVRKLAKDNAQLVQVLAPVVSGVRKDSGFTSASVAQLAHDLRGITRKDILTVTVPAASERQEDGSVPHHVRSGRPHRTARVDDRPRSGRVRLEARRDGLLIRSLRVRTAAATHRCATSACSAYSPTVSLANAS